MIDIGNRLELFVDDHLVDGMTGGQLRLHQPTRREIVMVHDEPWEGNASLYHTAFRDGDRFRMYYRGWHFDLDGDELTVPHPGFVCLAESTDGVNWTKPQLGLCEFDGSTKNNIVWGEGSHNFVPFKDANPGCKPEEQYKALAGEGGGLKSYKSPDGIHWSPMSDGPVITKGAFDSQNLAFWDSVRGEYREYHREFKDGRDIMTCTSSDFTNWAEPTFLDYTEGRMTELYTNQIIPYYRAPHIFLGFPSRYVAGRGHLTAENERLSRVSSRYGTDYTDGGFMASRDGSTFKLWGEAFIRPGLQQEGRWIYGDNYQNWGIVETETGMPGGTMELSIYASEGYWFGDSDELRRLTLRVDGFVSFNAPLAGGELVIRPFCFEGARLILNMSTSALGGMRVEIQEPDGTLVAGHGLQDCDEIFGDEIERVVTWQGSSDVSRLAGKPVRLRFCLRDADLYSFRFGP